MKTSLLLTLGLLILTLAGCSATRHVRPSDLSRHASSGSVERAPDGSITRVRVTDRAMGANVGFIGGAVLGGVAGAAMGHTLNKSLTADAPEPSGVNGAAVGGICGVIVGGGLGALLGAAIGVRVDYVPAAVGPTPSGATVTYHGRF